MQNAEFWICLVGCYTCFDKEHPTIFSILMGCLFLANASIIQLGKLL